jgi:DNA-directed RNA polymerase specialized sigma24 family protein
VLATALQDESLLVREATAQALGVLGDPNARLPLLTRILTEDEVFVRKAIAQALMRLEQNISAEFLHILLRQEEESVQNTAQSAINGLINLGLDVHEEIASIAPLIIALQSEDKSLQKVVISYLLGRAFDVANEKISVAPLITLFITNHQKQKLQDHAWEIVFNLVQVIFQERKLTRLLHTIGKRRKAISVSQEVETLVSEAFRGDENHLFHADRQCEAGMHAAMSDTIWRNIYPALHSLACYLVRTSPLPYWRGQEEDLADDIAQETVRRVIERAQKAERGEATPIQSLKQMANTIAYNYYRDLKRHDYRLSRLDTIDANTHGPYLYPIDVRTDLLDLAADKVDQDHLFDRLADEISHFPDKQKQAILVDLANRMYFDEVPTSLQESFLDVGIELRDYRQPLPENQRERGRYIALCSQAYKRIAHLPLADT